MYFLKVFRTRINLNDMGTQARLPEQPIFEISGSGFSSRQIPAPAPTPTPTPNPTPTHTPYPYPYP